MRNLKLQISSQILQQYPDSAIGYIVVDNLQALKLSDSNVMEEYSKSVIQSNCITLQNLVDFPTIAAWREVYRKCGLKPKTYKSSVESLLRRIIEGKYQSIIPVVDLYNYISAANILSVGGYDVSKLGEALTLRFSTNTDIFNPINGRNDESLTEQHIVYADDSDDDSVVCWMWNYKDCRRAMLTPETTQAIFIVDCICSDDRKRLDNTFKDFSIHFTRAGAKVKLSAFLNKDKPLVDINI